MNRLLLIAAAAAFASGGLVLAGCNDPAKDKPAAEVTAASVGSTAAQPATAAPLPGATRFVFSQADSKVTWVGAKVTASHDGSFGSFRGTVQAVDGNPEKSAVDLEIDMDSIQVEPAKLNGHLKSPDFFDVAKYPKARFRSTAIKAGAAAPNTHTVTGDLELHGVTRSVTFPAIVSVKGDDASAGAEFSINRKDWNIVYPGMANDLIKDTVLVRLDIHAKKR